MAKWTFMVYMAADDVLANFAVESLTQLKYAFSKRVAKPDVIDVIVKAQLGVEWSGETLAGPRGTPVKRSEQAPVFRRYIFSHQTSSSQNRTGTSQNWEPIPPPSTLTGSINNNAVSRAKHEIDMTDPTELQNFINWAYEEEGEDRSYCLIFWGHGPELLYEAPERGSLKTKRLYFTPVDLKNALEGTKLVEADKERQENGEETKFKIIGMDACAMSTIEFAYELKDLADFMVASQENVPDPSFPYTDLMERFQKFRNDPAELCRSAVNDYVQAYWDYFPNSGTGLKPVTLSALRLRGNNIVKLERALKDLVQQLQAANQSEKDAILEAREHSHGFVGGLFVDLRDFCEKLARNNDVSSSLKTACTHVSAVINDPNGAGFILANAVAPDVWTQRAARAPSSPCHGLSIYFPCLTEEDKTEIDSSNLLKGLGGTGGSPGAKDSEIVNLAATNIRYDVRREFIKDIENYYSTLKVEQTGWYDFIKHDWSRILAEAAGKYPKKYYDVDLRYSAEQCAINLASKSRSQGTRAS